MEVTREIDESSWGEVIGDKMHDYCYGQNDKRRDVWMIGKGDGKGIQEALYLWLLVLS